MKYRDMERTVGSKHLFREKLVNHLIKNGYTGWDGDQVRRRMDNLKKEFRANINPGTGSARKEWKFRKELCEVLRNDFYTPDPQKIRETATPVPPVSPDASNAPNAPISDPDTSCTSPHAITPKSFKTVKRTSEKGAHRPLDPEVVELLRKDVAAKERLVTGIEALLEQNKQILAAFAKPVAAAPAATATASLVQSSGASDSGAASSDRDCGECGNCDRCARERHSQPFFPHEFTEYQYL